MHPVCLLTFVLLLGLLVPDNGRAEDGSRTIRLADAVRAAIVNATGVVQQKLTVELKKGVIKEEQGTFDPLLTLSNSYDQSDTPYNTYYREYYNKPLEKQQTFFSSISLQHILPEGISFGPSVSLERTHDNLTYLTDNTSVLEFSVTVPLLKGAGRSSTGATLTAASIDLEAAGLDLVQTAAESTRLVAKSFWAALAAKHQLHIFQETEKDSKTLLENTRILVKKNEMPAIQLDTLTADVDSRTAERISQEQKLDAAKYQLVLDMGVEAIAMVDAFRVDGVFPHVDMSVAPAEDLLNLPCLTGRTWRPTVGGRNTMPFWSANIRTNCSPT